MEEESGFFDWAGELVNKLADGAINYRLTQQRMQQHGVYSVGADGRLYQNGSPVNATVNATSSPMFMFMALAAVGLLVFMVAKD